MLPDKGNGSREKALGARPFNTVLTGDDGKDGAVADDESDLDVGDEPHGQGAPAGKSDNSSIIGAVENAFCAHKNVEFARAQVASRVWMCCK